MFYLQILWYANYVSHFASRTIYDIDSRLAPRSILVCHLMGHKVVLNCCLAFAVISARPESFSVSAAKLLIPFVNWFGVRKSLFRFGFFLFGADGTNCSGNWIQIRPIDRNLARSRVRRLRFDFVSKVRTHFGVRIYRGNQLDFYCFIYDQHSLYIFN